MRRLVLFASSLAFLVSVLGCEPVPVPGLALVTVSGRALAVYAPDPENATRLDSASRPSAVYRLAAAVAEAAGLDLVLSLDIDATLELTAFADAEARSPLASATFAAAGPGPREYRLALPKGGPLGSLRLSLLDEGAAVVSGLRLAPSFTGFAASPVQTRSAAVVPAFAAGGSAYPVSLGFPAADESETYLVVRLAGAGTLRLAGDRAFEATVAQGTAFALPRSAFGPSAFSLSSPAGIAYAQLAAGREPPLSDLKAVLLGYGGEPGGLSASPDYRTWRWDILPSTLVMDFRDYGTQDRYLKRLAFFAEKPGFRGRLAGDGEIAGLHGWNAHDYPVWTLAAFYNLARETGFALNTEENALLELLVAHGLVLRSKDGRLAEGQGALISICRESGSALRRVFMDHEASHALFFQDADYRALAQGLWDSQDAEARRFWNLHFRWRSYDTGDAYLCVNELQAYHVQQAAANASAYLSKTVFPQLLLAYPDQAAFLESVKPRILARADADAASLDRYLRERWGLRAGSFGRAVQLKP